MSEKLALYFGCFRSGHYLYPGEPPPVGCPWTIRDMDGALLENLKVPDIPDGRVYSTCGGKPDLWIAFYWWDRSGDTRGASNSGFYVRGFEWADRAAAFAFASAEWPEVVERQKHPLVLVERPSKP